MPAINVGGAQGTERVWIPPELLWIEPHQPIRGKLPSELVSLMIDFARKPPELNAREIATRGVNILQPQLLSNNYTFRVINRLHGQSENAKDALVRLDGRFLTAPHLQYREPTPPGKSGQWKLTGRKLLTAEKLGILNVIGIGNPPLDQLTMVSKDLVQGFRTYGINLANSEPVVNVTYSPTTGAEDLYAGLQRLNSQQNVTTNPSLILVVIEYRNTLEYANIKRWGDASVGIPTIVCIWDKLLSQCRRDTFQANIALKVNLKLRGQNHALLDTNYGKLRSASGEASTMIVGADVTHPGFGSLPFCPSIAAVVASIDRQHTIYPGSVRLQASKQEIIGELDQMIAERLRCWYKKNRQTLPSSILFYRDGVSESQFALVKNFELQKIKDGCTLVGSQCGRAGYAPKITLVTVTKRHQTRFYPSEHLPSRLAIDGGNLKPGLVVDTVITSPHHFDFYLQSHGPRQSTARNGHYFVLENGMNLTADELQGITYKLCWLYARSTSAVSYVTPAYYADRLCDRARCWLQPMLANRYRHDIPDARNNEAGVLAIAKTDPDLWPVQPGRENPWRPELDDVMFYL